MIDQALWEQELAEHLHHDLKERAEFNEPDEFEDLVHLNRLDDTPHAEPPVYPAVAMILLWSLAIVAVSSVGWLLGYFVV